MSSTYSESDNQDDTQSPEDRISQECKEVNI